MLMQIILLAPKPLYQRMNIFVYSIDRADRLLGSLRCVMTDLFSNLTPYILLVSHSALLYCFGILQ